MSGHPACQYGERNQPPKTSKHLERKCDDREEKKDETRKKIVKLLNRWVDNIEKDCDLKDKANVCSGCLPEFTCLAPFSYKKPFCLHQYDSPLITNIQLLETRFTANKKYLQPDADTHTNIVYVEDNHNPLPVWERPRIKSQVLIGGEYKKMTDCFKKNGILPSYLCPRTPSCQLIGSTDEWIEMDRKQFERSPPPLKKCCCCPGKRTTLPSYQCISCDTPKTNKQQQQDVSPRGHTGERGHHHSDQLLPKQHHTGERGHHHSDQLLPKQQFGDWLRCADEVKHD